MKILTVVGARPQFIKAAVFSRLLRDEPARGIREILVHTGQHFDPNMSQAFFDELDIPPPDYHLGVREETHGRMTARMLEVIEEVLEREKPEGMIVYGDTNSTLAGALAAAKMSIPVAHVEAGARSFNRRMPEEINRIVTDRISTLLLCPTAAAVDHLREEGFKDIVRGGALVDVASGLAGIRLSRDQQMVVNVGDLMYDAVLYYGARAHEKTHLLTACGIRPGGYVFTTVHRAENTDDPEALRAIVASLIELAARIPVVWPLHPRTRKLLEKSGDLEPLRATGGVRLADPLSYLECICLEANAQAVVTDSGGVQREAFFLGIPCFTLRDETEWEETVLAGWNQLVGRKPRSLAQAVLDTRRSPVARGSPFGNGNAARTILELLVGWMG